MYDRAGVLFPLAAGFGIQLAIALVTEAAASPQGALIDAAVMASATDVSAKAGRIGVQWSAQIRGCSPGPMPLHAQHAPFFLPAALQDGGYGKIRSWASIGWGCTAPIAGEADA